MHADKLKGKEIILYARSLSPSLSKKEKRIANFISNQYQELTNMTISNLAKHLQVSESSITKVCKKLRCEGFYELKHAITEYVANGEESISDELHEDFIHTDDNDNILEKVFLYSMIALQDTLAVINRSALSKAIAALQSLKGESKLILVGNGGSGILCEDFQHKLLKIGIFSVLYRDSHMQLMGASLAKQGDVVVGVSHSGTSTDVINIFKAAQENGAMTICVTNHVMSPVTEFSDVVLHSSARNSPITGENAAARIAQLNILDVLFTALSLHRQNLSYKNLLKTQESVSSHRT
ncbi:SIS domain-containing protein [Terribacillus sp. DMT04]|uniref:SIS domain-containing protein n=1 Tax=Terribacillus sp. DMT04 TaxID=2850441 RepID=UPI001C2B85AC|nr:SIS domain-containing protein [Terribacillus sp. DMT04]QXE02330.1 SIS domain-containing protein [Terribacillus sp. DMT04]